jgi:hypothetical protein
MGFVFPRLFCLGKVSSFFLKKKMRPIINRIVRNEKLKRKKKHSFNCRKLYEKMAIEQYINSGIQPPNAM